MHGAAWGYLTGPSGLLQLGARVYWPEPGRFVQQDPIRDGMNWYVYVGNSPLVWVDPEGLDYLDIGYSFPVIGIGLSGLSVGPGTIVGLGPMFGVMLGADPCSPAPREWWDIGRYARRYVHPYVGGGLGTRGLSVNYAPGGQTPGHGWNYQIQSYLGLFGAPGTGVGPGVAVGLPAQANGQPFYEVGLGGGGTWGAFYYAW